MRTNHEAFLRQTHADQGGEASFEEWLLADWTPSEYAYKERQEYLLDALMRKNSHAILTSELERLNHEGLPYYFLVSGSELHPATELHLMSEDRSAGVTVHLNEDGTWACKGDAA